MTGDIVGYQVYKPLMTDKKTNDPRKGRYFTRLKYIDGAFGFENIDKRKRNIYVVEGVFKASVLHRLGYNSLAVLTNSPKRFSGLFWILNKTHNVVGIGDGDKAGSLLVKAVGRGFCSLKDIDEMSDDEIIKMINDYERK